MVMAKVFQIENSQVVRLPREFNFDEDEVVIKKVGDMLLLYPKRKEEEIFLSSLGKFTDDFFEAIEEGRKNQVQSERERL